MDVTCDAQLCTDKHGTPGYFTAYDGASIPVGACSEDRIEVWHGLDTPAYACGLHAQHSKVPVFQGHRNRIGER